MTKKVDIYELKKICTVEIPENAFEINHSGEFLKVNEFSAKECYGPAVNFSDDYLLKYIFTKEKYGTISNISKTMLPPYFPYQEIKGNDYTAYGYIAVSLKDIPTVIAKLLEPLINIDGGQMPGIKEGT